MIPTVKKPVAAVVVKTKFGRPRGSNNRTKGSSKVTQINFVKFHEDAKPTVSPLVAHPDDSWKVSETSIDKLLNIVEKQESPKGDLTMKEVEAANEV